MFCRRCRTVHVGPDGKKTYKQGRVLVDRLYPQDKRVELYCLRCGKRWFVKNNTESAFSKWLVSIESRHRRNFGIFS